MTRVRALLMSFLFLLATAGLVLPATTAQAATLTFTPTVDTFVNENQPTSSFGTQNVLKINAGTVEKYSYLRFAVTGIPTGNNVTSATLKVTTTGTAQNADTLRVYNVPGGWTNTTTWNTRPTLGSQITTAPITGPNQAITVTVPITGNGTYNFALGKTTLGNGDNIFHSREATNTAVRPLLTVNHDPAAQPPTFPACPTTVVRPFPSGTVLTAQYRVDAPGNSTYEFDGVRNTAYPNGSASPFAFGNGTPPANFCMNDGWVDGTVDPNQSWAFYHDNHNAACVRIVATNAAQVHRLRCDGIEDGLKFLENNNSVGNSNTTTFYSSGVWLAEVRDDCMENDFTLGGVLYDSLWEQCNTGLSERPASGNGTWTSPANETVTLDHMLIGLWDTNHDAEGLGSNGLFKWSTSANHLVIKCSTFMVPSFSLNGADAMDIPAGTVVDDSGCPGNPTTIVWLGGGAYPGNLNGTGITVTSSAAVWNNAVAAWKTAHPF